MSGRDSEWQELAKLWQFLAGHRLGLVGLAPLR